MSSSGTSDSHKRETKPKQHQVNEPRGEGQSRPNRAHRQSNYRSEKDNNSYDRSRDKKSNENHRERFNPPKHRDIRYHSGNRKNHHYSNSKAKYGPRKGDDIVNTDKLQKLSLEPSETTVIEEEIEHHKGSVSENISVSMEPQSIQSTTQTAKVKPFHGHYHHKNSNKPRFSKMFSENDKDTKNSIEEQVQVGVKEKNELEKDPGSKIEIAANSINGVSIGGLPETSPISKDCGDNQKESDSTRDEALIDQLKVISHELNNPPRTDDVFAKLKSGEGVELENLKQLYDKIPDITKTEIIKETEEWATSAPSTETVLQDNRTSAGDVPSEEVRPFPCCPHGNCFPPFFPHGFMPPALHPAYYYAALWNYHHPVPPPPVQRLANAPSLPAPTDNAALHKRYITRSTKTPGSIVFTLHVSDNLRIVSVRCEDTFTMTADLCNEEGEKIAENFVLHADNTPQLWEQYAFSGNHTLHFNLTAPSRTVVVVTFLHEIPLK